jgi:ribosomal protein S18 acetylase RimI-like enzyme
VKMQQQLTVADLRLSEEVQELDYHQLHNLMNLAAPWAQNRAIEDLQTMVANSNPVLHFWDGDFLVAFGRATSDGVYRAMLFDVIVHPRYQGKGIGRHLVETLLDHPQLRKVEKVFLVTTHQQGFYERLGFTENDTSTMVFVR